MDLQCILSPMICFNSPELSLNEQRGGHVKWTGITCPNNDHVLVERPNGKPACITTNMAEKMKWNLVYHRTEWMLEEYPISIKLNNLVLEYTREDYDNQKILAYITIGDKANFGIMELIFPKPAASLIFDNDNCSIFDNLSNIPKFDLKINQQSQNIFDVFYLAIDETHLPDRIGVSIQTSTDSSNVELLSICSVSVPLLDEILTVSNTNHTIKYTVNGQLKLLTLQLMKNIN